MTGAAAVAVSGPVAVETHGTVTARVGQFLDGQYEPVTTSDIAKGLGTEKKIVARVLRQLRERRRVLCVHEGTSLSTDPTLWVGAPRITP